MNRQIITAVLGLSAVLATASAQTITGAFTGTLTDASGAVVPNAKVTATNKATNIATSATTNDSGVYNILFLAVGE